MRGFWLSIVLSVASIAPAAHAAEYRLGVQDRVRVEVYEYPNVAGEYELGAAGTVALPLVGEIPAEGLTPAELASRINARLAALSHGTAASSATVEVAGYRPIFILGDVQNPGPYPFRPGLRMVQALALAGGVYRLQDLGMLRLSRDAISAAGEIQVLETRQVELIVERARLEAELSDAAALSLPDEIAQSARGTEAARPVMERQQALFTVRRAAFLKQVATMTRLIRSLRAEVGSLDRQNALKARQIDTVEQELTSARALVAQGLAPLARASR